MGMRTQRDLADDKLYMEVHCKSNDLKTSTRPILVCTANPRVYGQNDVANMSAFCMKFVFLDEIAQHDHIQTVLNSLCNSGKIHNF